MKNHKISPAKKKERKKKRRRNWRRKRREKPPVPSTAESGTAEGGARTADGSSGMAGGTADAEGGTRTADSSAEGMVVGTAEGAVDETVEPQNTVLFLLWFFVLRETWTLESP